VQIQSLITYVKQYSW